MKNPLKNLSRKVKERAAIAVLAFALGAFGVPLSEPVIAAAVGVAFDIAAEVQTDDSE